MMKKFMFLNVLFVAVLFTWVFGFNLSLESMALLFKVLWFALGFFGIAKLSTPLFPLWKKFVEGMCNIIHEERMQKKVKKAKRILALYDNER